MQSLRLTFASLLFIALLLPRASARAMKPATSARDDFQPGMKEGKNVFIELFERFRNFYHQIWLASSATGHMDLPPQTNSVDPEIMNDFSYPSETMRGSHKSSEFMDLLEGSHAYPHRISRRLNRMAMEFNLDDYKEPGPNKNPGSAPPITLPTRP